MKRAILIGLLTWAACAAVYYAILRGHIRYAPAAAIAAGLFLAGVIGTYRIALAHLRDAKQLAGSEAPIEGLNAAVTGPIRTSAPLVTPFTKRKAALYVYSVERDDVDAEGDPTVVKDYSGLAMAPCTIDSPFGAIRIAGFPLLEGVEPFRERSKAMQKAASAYVAATHFEGGSFGDVRQLAVEKVEQIRKDWRLTDVGVTPDSRIVEQVIEPGMTVCAIGKYENGAIVTADGLVPRLVAGAPDTAVATTRWLAKQNAIVATAIGLGVNFFVALPFVLPRIGAQHPVESAPRTAANRSAHEVPFEKMYAYHEAIRRGDVAAAQRMVAQGIPPNVRDLEEKTPLAIAANAATAEWLLAHGADVNAEDEHGETVLMEQATLGHADVVKLLIAKGAELDEADPRYHMTALQQAEYNEHMDVVEILRDAGAHDDRVTEKNASPLHEDDPPVRAALGYLDALFANDRIRMGSYWVPEKRSAFGDINLTTYQGARPHPAHLFSGFANDSAATLELRGPMPGGLPVTWRYDLVRVSGAWRIRDESWETRFDGER